MRNETVQGLIDELDNWLGITGHRVERGSKHARFVVDTESGSRFVTMSLTPSDRRATKNRIRDLRRVLREMGAEKA